MPRKSCFLTRKKMTAQAARPASPSAQRGDEIPLGARIFAVADTLDAMISDRPYRKALPLQTAKDEIERHAGTQFDPKVVEIFLSLPDSIWLELRQNYTAPFPLHSLKEV